MTNSEQLAEKVKQHVLSGGVVRLATCYRCTFLEAKHAKLVRGSSRPADNGIWVGKTFWMAYNVAFSK